jgi:DNA-binding PadR family transcriptional regulator
LAAPTAPARASSTPPLLYAGGNVPVAAADGGKRLYRITEAGEAALEEKKPVVEGIFRRMSEIHDRFEGPSPRIARAMQNLGAAIALRMRAGPVRAEELDTLVAAIDEAAGRVEKA